MKIRILWFVLAILLGFTHSLHAQGSAFTYQGNLNDNGRPANGTYDLRFVLLDALAAGNQVGSPLTNLSVAVSNGLFTVTLDFGANFPGADRWLELGVRTNGGGTFIILVPRQEITPAPYAIMASTASNLLGALPATQLSGTIPSAQLGGTYSGAVTFNNLGNSFSGSHSGNGTGLTGVNAATLGGLGSSNFWKTSGNAGTTAGTQFLGTTDNQPLELRVNAGRAFRLQPNPGAAPSVIGGSNSVDVSTVAGVIGGGEINGLHAFANYSTISGGHSNQIQDFAFYATVGGGEFNTIRTNGFYSTIGGGRANLVGNDAQQVTIAGGIENTIGDGANSANIAGGSDNTIQDTVAASSILGGSLNTLQTLVQYSSIVGGNHNTIQSNAAFSIIGGGEFNTILANVTGSVLGGGVGGSIGAEYCVIAGGNDNTIETNASGSVIGGGELNRIQTFAGTIGGGQGNTLQTNAQNSTIGGGSGNAIQTNANGSTIAGGIGNLVKKDSALSFIGGGSGHRIETNAPNSVIAGGSVNFILANSHYAVIGGGSFNTVSNGATGSTIAGGEANLIGSGATYATIPGGGLNTAAGSFSFAAGFRAKANHQGSFVWADSIGVDFASTAANQVAMRASGGYALYSNGAGTAGVSVAPGGTSWSVLSDRNVKKNFAPANGREILEKLASVPVQQWNYKWEADDAFPNLGPMAQDFKAAFYPGRDDKTITTLEFDGVELAAIQGLNQKLEQDTMALRSELNCKDAEIQQLKQRLDALENILVKTK